jgi:hypothetical protein
MLVDEPVLGGPDQPSGGPVRDAVPRPVVGRGDERLLDRVLGRVEVACPSGDDTEDLRCEIAEQVLDGGGDQTSWPVAVSSQSSMAAAVPGPLPMIRRTWIGCWTGTPSSPGTAEYFAAISTARSSESTSTIW